MEKILLTKALESLIQDSANGIRVQKNGKPLSKGSIVNYKAVLRNLRNFETKKQKNLFPYVTHREQNQDA